MNAVANSQPYWEEFPCLSTCQTTWQTNTHPEDHRWARQNPSHQTDYPLASPSSPAKTTSFSLVETFQQNNRNPQAPQLYHRTGNQGVFESKMHRPNLTIPWRP
ncbi:hypothetical protein N7519_007753 [Penicillium mononematosum]|uniref:uncharacterized protein n=1 Tax=Penicillium mononematosum TaxID=268346 RepID=UPI002547C6F9|nr:uncharacterized protein N7519_007753 [Penicillium mononematosum]KAJ6186452.1 hypothetical protein N7519_007753 [Penicillium mononematosum]